MEVYEKSNKKIQLTRDKKKWYLRAPVNEKRSRTKCWC